MAIQILIVDHDPVFRLGLRMALEASPDMKVVGEAGNGGEAVESVEKLEPDIVLMDAGKVGMGALEATRDIRELRPKTKVFLFTVDDATRTRVTEAIQAGVSGDLREVGGIDHIIRGVKRAYEGKVRPDPPTLSPRELDIARFLATGMTAKEVAYEMGLSARTVEMHLERIYDKLGARDRLPVRGHTHLQRLPLNPKHAGLSVRAREVLHLAKVGLTPQEVASRLGISRRKVARHAKRIAEVLGIPLPSHLAQDEV